MNSSPNPNSNPKENCTINDVDKTGDIIIDSIINVNNKNQDKTNKKNNQLSLLLKIVFVLFLLIILYFVFVSKSTHRNNTTRLIAHGGHIKNYFYHYPKLKNEDKLSKEWKNVIYSNTNKNTYNLNYLYINPKENNHFNNDDHNKKNNIFVICHGSTWPLEYCYKEYKNISEKYNSILISLEYPGFSEHDSRKTTEQSILYDYPKELAWLIETHLKLNWSDVMLFGQCFGAVPALQLASSPNIKLKLKSLCLTKPFTSWHNVLKSAFFKYPFTQMMPNVLNIFDTTQRKNLKSIKCNVYCIQGKNDKICSLENTNKLISEISNANSTLLLIVPNTGHELSIDSALRLLHEHFSSD